jgi:hypothetical protein
MPVLTQRLLCIVFLAFFFLLAPSTHAIKASHPKQKVASIQPPSFVKPVKAKHVLSKIVLKLMSAKKHRSAVAIAFGILSVLVLSFIVFIAAYGGASGGVIILTAVVGIALIIFGLIKISKRKRKKAAD